VCGAALAAPIGELPRMEQESIIAGLEHNHRARGATPLLKNRSKVAGTAMALKLIEGRCDAPSHPTRQRPSL
jgi:hypothetical protein